MPRPARPTSSDRRTFITLTGLALVGSAVAGCTSAARHHLAMSGPTGSAGLIGGVESDTGPGPSLIAGDRLAIRTLLAGGYDLNAPRPDSEPTRFATVPAAE